MSAALVLRYRELLRAHGLRPIPTSSVLSSDQFERLRQQLTAEAAEAALEVRALEEALDTHAATGDLSHEGNLGEWATRAERAVTTAGLHLDRPVYVGEFPTGSFNAQVQAMPEGAIILLNSGLLWFVYQAMKILSLSVEFSDTPEDREHRYTEDDKAEAAAEMVLAYLFFEDTLHRTTRIPLRHPARMQVAEDLWGACMFFAVAHEYGHVLAGHLNKARSVVANTIVGGLNLVKKEWEQEYEADQTAAVLMIAAHAENRDRKLRVVVDNDTKRMQVIFSIAGAFIFLSLDSLITRIATEISGKRDIYFITDHPPSGDRIAAIREYLERAGLGRYLPEAEYIAGWAPFMEDRIVERIGPLIGARS